MERTKGKILKVMIFDNKKILLSIISRYGIINLKITKMYAFWHNLFYLIVCRE